MPLTAPPTLTPEERAHWVLLVMVPGIGPTRFQRLLDVCGSATAAWRASDVELAQAGLDRRALAGIHKLRHDVTVGAIAERLERLKLQVLTTADDSYPAPLLQTADPPPVLFVRGSLAERDALSVALVGTRRATPYGRAVAERFAADLALAGVTVISGLAKGVDTVAHRAALDAGGRTIAVLGNGLDQVYPAENAGLARRIVESGQGAVISEFPPGTKPDAQNFPRRNRIIAGLSRATVVVEAGLKSGALITSDFALEQGRDVLAVPGSILSPMSEGPNLLIKDGAPPAISSAAILEALGLADTPSPSADRLPPGLSPDESEVYRALSTDPRTVDDLAHALGRNAGEVSASLTLLELRGYAQPVGPLTYVRAGRR